MISYIQSSVFSNFYFRTTVIVLSIGYGLYNAINLAWLCDDSYISFVYARNLWLGNGLVFNPNDLVEGYSNFIWTILLSLSFPIGIRIEDLAICLGILFYLGTLFLLPNMYLVLTYSIFYHGSVFATSGLETSLFTFTILLGYHFYKNKNWNQFIITYSLLILIRPEGFFFLASAILLSALSYTNTYGTYTSATLDYKEKIAHIRKYIVSNYGMSILFVVTFIAIYLCKAIYYGDMLPNTYYAKAGEGQYFRQGFEYFRLFFKEYPMMSVFLLFGIVFSRSHFSWIVIFYLAYILYVGGDFMFARFIVPIVPVAIVLVWDRLNEASAVWIERFPRFGHAFSIAICILFVFSSLFRGKIYETNPWEIWKSTGIGEERMFYKNLGSQELVYSKVFVDQYAFAFFGAQAHFIYHMKPRLAIESSTGLTDKYIAKQKIDKRSKIGHEKKSPLKYLIDRKINVVMGDHYPELSASNRNIIYNWNGNLLTWKMLTHDQEMVDAMLQDGNFDLSQLKPNEWTQL
ncbi:hypothetical protein [Leptospira sp. GIMC2001]|uniref:hypothetical protein n=1 Tax=Leptospira sp. GIMC2001 TaxID=1513297 RepID=UPI002349C7DC|nr:hypothetical protein [Leptospira sp. GIMC2001]WCL48638.1 hypothetical protein O4O04_15185 [Leptospira sp. GIMC2001]